MMPRGFKDVAILVAEGIEDQTRGEVSNVGWDIDAPVPGAELMHMEFTCDGKRYRVELRELSE